MKWLADALATTSAALNLTRYLKALKHLYREIKEAAIFFVEGVHWLDSNLLNKRKINAFYLWQSNDLFFICQYHQIHHIKPYLRKYTTAGFAVMFCTKLFEKTPHLHHLSTEQSTSICNFFWMWTLSLSRAFIDQRVNHRQHTAGSPYFTATCVAPADKCK